MRLRLLACVLALLLAAAPVLGIVCQMGCDQPPKAVACHESTSSSPEGPSLRGLHHACDHDHAATSPALAAGTSARDAVEGAFVSVAMPAVRPAPAADVRATTAHMHGPPGPSGRGVNSRTSVLRI